MKPSSAAHIEILPEFSALPEFPANRPAQSDGGFAKFEGDLLPFSIDSDEAEDGFPGAPGLLLATPRRRARTVRRRNQMMRGMTRHYVMLAVNLLLISYLLTF